MASDTLGDTATYSGFADPAGTVLAGLQDI
jgi:hypothetical protein